MGGMTSKEPEGPEAKAKAAVEAAATEELNPDGDTPPAKAFTIVTSVGEYKDVMEDLPDVMIDKPGTRGFKYVLFKVTDSETEASKVVVRGTYASMHRHVFRRMNYTTGNKSSEAPSGGGRIVHTDDCILVFGESGDYGLGDHKFAAEHIFRLYGDTKTVAYIPAGTEPGY